MSNNSDNIRFGLIGAGKWGKNIIRTINEIYGVSVAKVSSKKSTLKKEFNNDFIVVEDWQDVISDKSLDGIIIASPSSTHYEIARSALENGHHIFVEKPLVTSSQQAETLRKISEETGLVVFVDHTHLFSPAYTKLKAILAENASQKIKGIKSTGGNTGPYRSDVSALWDYGPHDIALCLDLMQKTPDQINIQDYLKSKVGDGIGEIIDIEMIFSGTTKAKIKVGNLITPKTRYFSVYLNNATLVYDDQAEHKLVQYPATELFEIPAGPGKGIILSDETPLKSVLVRFVRLIKENQPDKNSLNLAVEVVKILERCESIIRK